VERKKFNIAFFMVFSITLVAFLISLSGCSGLLGDGRMDAWKEVRRNEEATKQEFLKTKQAEIGKEKPKQNPTMKLTTYDQNGKVVSTAEMDLQPVIAEITGGKKDDGTYGINISETPAPKGESAENIAAAGVTAEKILNSPAAVGTVVGVSVGAALRETGGGGAKINGETINVDDSFNRSESKALGYGNTVSGSLSTDKSNKTELAEALPAE